MQMTMNSDVEKTEDTGSGAEKRRRCALMEKGRDYEMRSGPSNGSEISV